jgi:acetolactate synthase-1/2/3 large subunit
MKASDLFVQSLEKEGVEYIFGIPGEENLDLLESLRTSKKIRLILTRHEQGAGFMAATYGRLTGKVGVCLSTLGPGATNLVTPAAYAQLGAMPMLMITGQKPIRKSKQGKFQIVDIVKTMTPITKLSHQIASGDTVAVTIREAFRIALEERPGAVHIELPEDIASEETDSKPFEVYKWSHPVANLKEIELATQMIKDAKCPLLLIGAAASRSSGLEEFVNKTGIYFFDSQMGKGAIDESHPQFLGTAALSSNDYIHLALERADLIINVGHDIIEKPPFFMNKLKAKVIHINHFSANVDNVYFPELDVVGDITKSIQEITKRLEKYPKWSNKIFKSCKEGMDKHIFEGSQKANFPCLPQFLVSQVRKVMPSDGIVTLDNGVYKIWFARNYYAHKANTLLLDNVLATMGAGLSSAIAAKLIHPNKKVLSISGDGGFMMNSQELETAVRLKIDLVVMILRDNAYGMIKWKQTSMGFENFGLDYSNPDFVKYAESFGAQGHALKSAEELEPKLSSCLNSKGVHLIDVLVDYSENERVLIEELRNKTKSL